MIFILYHIIVCRIRVCSSRPSASGCNNNNIMFTAATTRGHVWRINKPSLGIYVFIYYYYHARRSDGSAVVDKSIWRPQRRSAGSPLYLPAERVLGGYRGIVRSSTVFFSKAARVISLNSRRRPRSLLLLIFIMLRTHTIIIII